MPRGPDVAEEFRAYTSVTEGNPYEELFASVSLEETGKGRLGAVLVRPDEAGGVPLVRTTSQYGNPAQRFRAVHERLARAIQARAALPVGFNNALVENYTNAYTKMGSHSDQALDLADGSFIAVFSCYQRPELASRKLVVEAKGSGGRGVEIPLAHDSMVVFSVDTNRRYKHRIVLEAPAADNQWLGVTFRTSKTLIRFRDGQPYLPGGRRLALADDDERDTFYRLRRRENSETDFSYPELAYTISESDLKLP